MIIFIAVCAGITTATFVVLTIFIIMMANQVRLVARSISCVYSKLNHEIEKLQYTAGSILNIARTFWKIASESIGTGFNLISYVISEFRSTAGSVLKEETDNYEEKTDGRTDFLQEDTMSQHDGSKGQLLTFLLLGAAAGAVAGLLLAPRSGKETRKRLSVWKDDMRDKRKGSFGRRPGIL